ncbi:hypothetical protein D3C87_535010 [compost metagenome]
MTTIRSAGVPGSHPGNQDPRQKKRLVLGVSVWVLGWVLGLGLIPVVEGSSLSEGIKTTLNGVLLLGFPKLFLVLAVAIMGKPGFAYLKSLIGARLRRFAPPSTVSPLRYRIGLILFIAVIVLSSMGPYIVPQSGSLRLQHPHLVAMSGDLLLILSLFILGGDFWDKLRALFVREAKAVFPHA